jgi:RNA-dependent RNA polymerase
MPAIGTLRTSGTPFLVNNSAQSSPPIASPALARAMSDDPAIRHSPQRPFRATLSVPPSAGPGPKLEMSDDGYFLVAHDRVAQELMDNYDLPWGVQYELARGVTRGWWQWSDIVPEKIGKFKAVKDQKMAPSYVTEIMLGRKPVNRNIELWCDFLSFLLIFSSE